MRTKLYSALIRAFEALRTITPVFADDFREYGLRRERGSVGVEPLRCNNIGLSQGEKEREREDARYKQQSYRQRWDQRGDVLDL